MKHFGLLLIALLALSLVGAQCTAPPSPTATPLPATQVAPTQPPAPTEAPKAATKGQVPLAPEGTLLRKIQDRGKLIAGVKYDVPTFGYLNPTTNQLEGFDVDLVKYIANYILGDPNAVEFKQAVSKDRIPFLQNGVVDIIASTMTINAERAQQIDFSDVYYVAGQSLLVPLKSNIASVNDLKGKNVCTVKGSTPEQNIRKFAPEANVILFDTYSECVAAMDSGRVDAVTTDDIILLGYAKESPDKYKVVGERFTVEPYGVGIAKGNQELLDAVNAAIRQAKQSGEWARIYETNLGTQAPAEPPPQDWHQLVQ
jgi:putative glutamine transport system substrate-binding protein